MSIVWAGCFKDAIWKKKSWHAYRKSEATCFVSYYSNSVMDERSTTLFFCQHIPAVTVLDPSFFTLKLTKNMVMMATTTPTTIIDVPAPGISANFSLHDPFQKKKKGH